MFGKVDTLKTYHYADGTNIITASFKILRKTIKSCSMKLSGMNDTNSGHKHCHFFPWCHWKHQALTNLETSFRKDLKGHLAALLKKQIMYWRRSENIKWVTLGGEITIFLHSNATI